MKTNKKNQKSVLSKNGLTIELGGVKTSLTFGMIAVEEFGNLQAVGGASWTKLMTDLVYSGYCNEEILSRRNPTLSYGDVSSLVDDLILSKDPVLKEVFNVFCNSRAGASLMKDISVVPV